jgi:hypothetical protein
MRRRERGELELADRPAHNPHAAAHQRREQPGGYNKVRERRKKASKPQQLEQSPSGGGMLGWQVAKQGVSENRLISDFKAMVHPQEPIITVV